MKRNRFTSRTNNDYLTVSSSIAGIVRVLGVLLATTTTSGNHHHHHHHGMSQSIPIPIHIVGHNNPASASASSSSSSGHATGVAEALSPPQQRRRTKRWVVVDFDGTCTTQDTTPLLPRLASLVDSHQQHILRSQTTTTTTTSNATNSTTTTVSMVETAVAEWQERRPVFKELEDEYFRRYVGVLESINAEFDDDDDFNDDVNDGFNDGVNNDDNESESHPTSREVRFLQLMERLEVSLDRLDVVSTQITEMVTESSVLRGLGSVTHHELLEAMQLHDDEHEHEHERDKRLSESLRLHPGCLSVLKQCASREHHSIGVLSINWCPALIRAVLLHPLCEPGHDDDDDDDAEDGQHDDKKRRLLPAPEDIPVWSNTVDRHGAVSLPIPGAVAKKERIIRLQTQTQTTTATATTTTTATTQEERATVVYVGDSSTDLLALIQADVGILIGRSESTLAMAARFGVTLRPLTEFSHDKNKNNNNNNNNNYRTSDDMHMDVDADAGDSNQSTRGSSSSRSSGSGGSSSGVVWSAADWGEIGSFLDEF